MPKTLVIKTPGLSWEIFKEANKAMMDRLNVTTLQRIYENDPELTKVTLVNLLNNALYNELVKIMTSEELKLFSECMKDNNYVTVINLDSDAKNIVVIYEEDIANAIRPQLKELSLYNYRIHPQDAYSFYVERLPTLSNLKSFAHAVFVEKDFDGMKGEFAPWINEFKERIIQRQLLSYALNYNTEHNNSIEFENFNSEAQDSVAINRKKVEFLYLLVELLKASKKQAELNFPVEIWVKILSYVVAGINKTDNQLYQAATVVNNNMEGIGSKPYTPFIITEPREVGSPFSLMFKPMLSSPGEQNIETEKEHVTTKKHTKKTKQ